MERLLRIEEVAELTGVPVATLRWWRAQSPPQGPKGAKLGRRLVWREVDVQAWLDELFEGAER